MPCVTVGAWTVCRASGKWERVRKVRPRKWRCEACKGEHDLFPGKLQKEHRAMLKKHGVPLL